MLNKTTLAAIGAALIALGHELQGSETSDTAAAPEAQPTPRRGRGPAKTTETPPSGENPPAAGKTAEELREIARVVIEAPGKAVKLKAFLETLDAAKISDIPADKQPAFIAEVKRLQAELEAEAM